MRTNLMCEAERAKERREKLGLTQKDVESSGGPLKLADSLVTERVVRKVENQENGLKQDEIDQYFEFLGIPSTECSIPEDRLEDIVLVLKTAVLFAMDAIRLAFWRPSRACSAVFTTDGKVSDRDNDPTLAVDLAPALVINSIMKTVCTHSSPSVFAGFNILLVDEEKGAEWIVYDTTTPGRRTIIVFADPLDDTHAFRRHIGGGVCVLTVYLEGWGILASVAGDLGRNTLTWRITDAPSQSVQLKNREIPKQSPVLPESLVEMSEIEGSPLALKTTGRRQLAGSSLVMYSGKPDRILENATITEKLMKAGGIAEVFSVGGVRSSLGIGYGCIDSLLEVAKGFRLLDVSGVYLADGCGATCLELNRTGKTFTSKPFNFGAIPAIDSAIATGFADMSVMDATRRKHVCTATLELCRELLSHI